MVIDKYCLLRLQFKYNNNSTLRYNAKIRLGKDVLVAYAYVGYF